MGKKHLTARDEKKLEFKRRFLAARLEANISQVQLSKRTGISNSTISNYEVGKTLPDDANMKKLLKVLPRLAETNEAQKGSPKSKAQTKPSLIEEAKVSPDQARVSYMSMLVKASQGLKDLEAQAERAGIPKEEARAMLKELGVSLQ